MNPGQTLFADDFVKFWLTELGHIPVDDATSYQNSFLDVSPSPGDTNSDPLVVLGEAYNATPRGHVGLQIPGYTPLDGASRTGAYKRLALTGLASTAAYRTNVALMVVGGTTGKWVSVHVYTPDGVKLRDLPVFVDGVTQVSNGALFGNAPRRPEPALRPRRQHRRRRHDRRIRDDHRQHVGRRDVREGDARALSHAALPAARPPRARPIPARTARPGRRFSGPPVPRGG